jgi:hypothetical protein
VSSSDEVIIPHCYRLVTVREHLLAALDNRDLRTKAVKHLPRLQSDINTAQNDQRARKLPQFDWFIVGEQIAG